MKQGLDLQIGDKIIFDGKFNKIVLSSFDFHKRLKNVKSRKRSEIDIVEILELNECSISLFVHDFIPSISSRFRKDAIIYIYPISGKYKNIKLYAIFKYEMFVNTYDICYKHRRCMNIDKLLE